MLVVVAAHATDNAPSPPRQAETAISGVFLNDPQSAKTPWGINVELDDPESDHPRAYVCNQDKSEKLTLIYYEGDTANIISEFRAETVQTRYADCALPSQPIAHFVTAKGVALGMAKSELIRILGNDYIEHRQPDETVLIYRIDNQESGFLQRHGVSSYYGQYHFQGNRLVKFAFGFEFP